MPEYTCKACGNTKEFHTEKHTVRDCVWTGVICVECDNIVFFESKKIDKDSKDDKNTD